MIAKKKKGKEIHVRFRQPGISFDYVIYIGRHRDRDSIARLAISQLAGASRQVSMAVAFKRIEALNSDLRKSLIGQNNAR